MAAAIGAMTSERDGMSVVVVVPDDMADEVSAALVDAGISHGRAAATGLDTQVTVVPISVAKGLEVDGVVVVEPARIVESEIQGLRALYVALTRPTQRLTIVHAEPLPEPLAAGVAALDGARSSACAESGRRELASACRRRRRRVRAGRARS